MSSAMHGEALPGLPTHMVVTHLLKFLDDPADLARLECVSRGARDAVATTGREVAELEETDAAQLGCLSALRRLERRGLLDKKHFCTVAARCGNIESLQWARDIAHGMPRCPWDKYTCASAARGGHLEVLKWLRYKNCPWGETSAAAATRPEVEIIEWVHTNGCPWSDDTCSNAAGCGNLEVLKYARKHFCPWN